MLKRRLRRWVVASARPPFDRAYRALYRGLVRVATRVLRRQRGVLAVYLCRGCARDQISPGISDIDLTVVTTADPAVQESVRRAYRALGTATLGLIDYFPRGVVSRAMLEQRWRSSPAWQHRYREGQTSWQLLHGIDVLAELTPLSPTAQRAACYAELCRWWLMFADLMIGSRRCREDSVFRNSLCYKVVTESLNLRHELRTAERRPSRAAALEGWDTAWARKLAALARDRFLPTDEALPQETYAFLLDFWRELWDEGIARPFPIRALPQDVDVRTGELPWSAADDRMIDTLARHIAGHWRGTEHRLHAIHSAFWQLDDLLIVIDSERPTVPTFEDLVTLVALHAGLRALAARPSFLFLRLGDVAFPLTPAMPREMHRGLLTPATTPDVFLQLGSTKVGWSDFADWYLGAWRTNEQWTDAPADKQRQLDSIVASARRGRVVYPLSRAALERCSP